MSDFDVAVIGAGPGGYVAAIRCAQLGLRTVCIDKWKDDDSRASLGGTCLNVGCIPSKALLDSSHLYESMTKEAHLHGINPGNTTLDLNKMQARKNTIINNLSSGIAGLFRKNGVESVFGSARLVSSTEIEVTATDGSCRSISADNMILATGSVPVNIPQAQVEESIVDNAGALGFDEVPVDLGIIGAGVIGLELGSVWRRLGANVTLLEMCDEFLPMADHEIAAQALKYLRAQGLDIRLGAKVTDTDNDEDYVSVTYADENGEHEEEFDKLIVAVGRKACTEELGLVALGIETDARGFIVTDEQCQTSVENIYAIGDVCQGPMLAHRASKDGVTVAENIAGSNKKPCYKHIPWVIYTWPEIAWFGETEQALRASDTPCKIGQFPFMASGRAHAMNSAEGMVKIIAAEDDTILGMHIIGPNASELIATGVASAAKGHTYKAIIDEIHAHPTLSEALHEAALDIENRAIHF